MQTDASASRTSAPRATPPRAFSGGFLMGLANLVPGVSGGTMILAIGLYESFIGAVAELTTFRWSRSLFVFCAFLGAGLVVAVLGLAGPAVWLVQNVRWVMYSLFIGMTLGGVPELVRLARPLNAGVWLAGALGLAGMAWLTFGSAGGNIEHNALSFAVIGAAAASSMILPGVSGSYILLIFGFYDVVIGSMSASALLDDPAASLKVVVPVGVGVVVGVALLSNVLKFVLARWSGPSHGALLGLLVGAVLGLYPFQDSVHPELANRSQRKAIEMLLEGAEASAIEAEHGVVFEAAEAERLRAQYGAIPADQRRGEFKRLGLELERYSPGLRRILGAIGLAVVGFLSTMLLGRGSSQADSARA